MRLGVVEGFGGQCPPYVINDICYRRSGGHCPPKFGSIDRRLMPNYRRSRTCGGTYFFTEVTHRRQRILTLPESRIILREVVRDVRKIHPFTVDGWVLLPDHLHCMWTLPDNDNDFSKRWGMIKARFSKRAESSFFNKELLSTSRKKHRESTLWQRRFWEHEIRDENDFNRHLDYIHYNPVKHGLVGSAIDWPYSTFHRLVKEGAYAEGWGSEPKGVSTGEFGE